MLHDSTGSTKPRISSSDLNLVNDYYIWCSRGSLSRNLVASLECCLRTDMENIQETKANCY